MKKNNTYSFLQDREYQQNVKNFELNEPYYTSRCINNELYIISSGRLRKENNKVELKNLAENDYANLIILLKDFYTAHKNVWFTDNKPFGFDVQDIRMGGMERRIERSQLCNVKLRC